MKTLIIVPCGKHKIWDRDKNTGPTKAKDAYIGPVFRVNRAFAEKFSKDWLILSAKYGFISPDFLIPENYDLTFGSDDLEAVNVSYIYNQLKEMELDRRFEAVIALGGKKYRRAIEDAFEGTQVQVVSPFAGLGCGKLIQATKAFVEKNSELDFLFESNWL